MFIYLPLAGAILQQTKKNTVNNETMAHAFMVKYIDGFVLKYFNKAVTMS